MKAVQIRTLPEGTLVETECAKTKAVILSHGPSATGVKVKGIGFVLWSPYTKVRRAVG